MAGKTPVTTKLGQLVIIPEPWIISLIEINSDIVPNKYRKVLLDVLQKGYVEDGDAFSEALNVLLMIISGESDIEKLSPEVRLAMKEGKELKEKRKSSKSTERIRRICSTVELLGNGGGH